VIRIIPTSDPLRCIHETIKSISFATRFLDGYLTSVVRAWKNVKQLRKKASEDGVPGSNEAFYGPVMELRAHSENLKSLANNILAHTDVLLSKPPEEW